MKHRVDQSELRFAVVADYAVTCRHVTGERVAQA
jgi:hypothetical protein